MYSGLTVERHQVLVGLGWGRSLDHQLVLHDLD